MNRLRLTVPILALTISANIAIADVVTDYATGKCGKDLLTTLHEHCAPANLSTNQSTSGRERILTEIFAVDDKTKLPDFLSSASTVGNGVLRISNHILPEWFNQGNSDKNLAAADLFNTFPTTQANRDRRNTLPLLDTSDSSTGAGVTTDGKYQAYQPADRWKGVLARMAMYVATIYGRPSAWQGNGTLVFDDFQDYPLLSQRAIRQYLEWHHQFPADNNEIEWARRIERMQGNLNPFILHPTLADHIWGTDTDNPFIPPTSPDNPDDPDSPIQPIPLHAVYDSDETIYLYSPHINRDSEWSIDGNPVDATTIKASDIGRGQHELHFNNSTQSGKLIITVQ